MLSGLALAVVMAVTQTADPAALANTNPAPATEADANAVDGEGPRPDVARRQNPDEVVCRTAPVTGSRFNQRRCQTRAQAAKSQTEAQRMVGELTRSSGSTDAALTAGPATGPQ